MEAFEMDLVPTSNYLRDLDVQDDIVVGFPEKGTSI